LVDGQGDRAGRAAVLLNAGAAVYVSGIGSDMRDGIERAAAALEDRSAALALERLVLAQPRQPAKNPAAG
jgi:anthranilate phosphoribosyltransferase